MPLTYKGPVSKTRFYTDEISAAAISASAALDGREKVIERDLEEALSRELASSIDDAEVSRQGSLKLESWVGRLGNADISIGEWPSRCLLELKWGDLPACAWDTVKLATALAEGQCRSAFLVAGARSTYWQENREGAELFGSAEWGVEDLLARYARWFAFWRRDVANYPEWLAADWIVIDRSADISAGLLVDDVPHQIRVAEIQIRVDARAPIDYVPMVKRRR